MINYVNEILETAKLPIGEAKEVVSLCCVCGKTLVVNNYIKILTYSSSHIVLKIKDDELIIDGKDLIIKQLDKKDICWYVNLL